MNDIETKESPQSSDPAKTPRRAFFKRAAVAAAIAGVAAGTGLAAGLGVQAFAHGGGPGRWHRAAFMGGALDPAMLDEHLDRMLKHLYVEIDATPAQQQQLAPIVKAAAQDLLPFRGKMRDARRQAALLLTQPTVDRAALEALRAEQLQLAVDGSKRLVQALADVADVLTPAQKGQLAVRLERWRGARG